MFTTIKNFILKNKNRVFAIAFCILYFCLGIGLFNLDLYISFLIFGVLLLYLLISRDQTKAVFNALLSKKKELLIILIFSSTFFLFATVWDFSHVFQNGFHLIFLPIIFFVPTSLFYLQDKRLGLFFIISFFSGLFFQGLLIAGNTFAYSGIFNNTSRQLYDVWTNKRTSCTALTVYLGPLTGLSIYFIINPKQLRFLLPVFISIPLISSFLSYTYQNRSFFVILFILIICNLLYSFSGKQWSSKIAYIVCAVIFGCFGLYILAVILISNNVFNIAEKIIKIPFLYRVFSGGSNSERINLYKEFFSQIYYIFGGIKLKTAAYVHNVWLDIYATSGLIPSACFILLSVYLIIFYIKAPRGDGNCTRTTFPLLMGWMLVGFFEPIFHISYYAFNSIFFFIALWFNESQKTNGLFQQLTNAKKRKSSKTGVETTETSYHEIKI